jgi:DNA-binding response OmpR family regulator
MHRKKILLIEDEKNVRENIQVLLEEEGYNFLSCADGKSGIESAKINKPDLILCDIMMQGVDGYEVLEELSNDEITRTIPFIFLTAKVEREDIRMGMQLGADDYLFKPFKADELLSAIETRLRKAEIIKAEIPKTENIPEVNEYDLDDKMFVNVNGVPNIINIKDIEYITAENQYTSIKLITDKSILIRKSIKYWENLLPNKYFLRIHRSTIINLGFIVKMEKWYNSSFVIFLKDVKEPFIISKRYSSLIRKNKL